jgi:hypothetical protein
MSLTYAPSAMNGTLPDTNTAARVDLGGRKWVSTAELRMYSAGSFEWSLDDGTGVSDGIWHPVLAGAPFAIPLSQAHLRVWTRNRNETVYWTILGSDVVNL